MGLEEWGPLLKKQVVLQTIMIKKDGLPKKVNILNFKQMRVLKREPTRKRGEEPDINKYKGHFRDVPIVEDDNTKPYIRYVLKYLLTLDDDDPLFPISRQQALEIMHACGIYNHYMRHQRASRLVIDNSYTGFELQQYIGWKTGAITSTYTHLNSKNLLDKQISTAKWKEDEE